MISKNTAPGTKVVYLRHFKGWRLFGNELPRLEIGQVYTVADMPLADDGDAGVRLIETMRAHTRLHRDGWGWFKKCSFAYDRRQFDYLALPESITKLLDVAPINIAKESETVR